VPPFIVTLAGSHSSATVIVAASIAGVVVVLAIIVAAACIARRRRQQPMPMLNALQSLELASPSSSEVISVPAQHERDRSSMSMMSAVSPRSSTVMSASPSQSPRASASSAQGTPRFSVASTARAHLPRPLSVIVPHSTTAADVQTFATCALPVIHVRSKNANVRASVAYLDTELASARDVA
jgi:hypothetical protein